MPVGGSAETAPLLVEGVKSVVLCSILFKCRVKGGAYSMVAKILNFHDAGGVVEEEIDCMIAVIAVEGVGELGGGVEAVDVFVFCDGNGGGGEGEVEGADGDVGWVEVWVWVEEGGFAV